MKITRVAVILALSFVSLSTLAQTADIEKDNLMSKYQSGELTQLEFKHAALLLRELLDSIGYPSLPYDTVSDKIEYIYFHSLDGIPRETIVNRVYEWAAVTFGNTNGLLTQQENVSRLIVNGTIAVPFPDMFNPGSCYFTLVFTIREGRLKSQVINIFYEFVDYVNYQNVNRTLNSYFPVTNNKLKEWKAILALVKETEAGLGIMMDQLVSYIQAYENDYDW